MISTFLANMRTANANHRRQCAAALERLEKEKLIHDRESYDHHVALEPLDQPEGKNDD